jgi:hypothetical protein
VGRGCFFLMGTAACISGCLTANVAFQCPAGSIPRQGACAVLCVADFDCKTASAICTDGVCTGGARTTPPSITSVDGDGPTDMGLGHTAHAVVTDLIIHGTNLTGSAVTLGSTHLKVCSESDLQLVVELPGDLVSGQAYVLTVANQAGSCSANLPVLQGPAGPDLSADHLVTRLNGASTQLSPSILPAATPSTAGTISAPDQSKLSAYSAPGGSLNCVPEYSLVENAPSVASYVPTPTKRAELLQYGWICWDYSGAAAVVHPYDNGVFLSDGYYAGWDPASYRACGRINFVTLANSSNYILTWIAGYYYGLKYMDGATNTWHVVWANGAGEAGGTFQGSGHGVTIWTCR